jgi:NhaA family Na+:H+ antiporter
MIQKAKGLFLEFFNSEKSSGIVLLFCTATSLIFANTVFGATYRNFWNNDIQIPFINGTGISFSLFINDGLMTIFFLLVGLEIEREIYIGELSHSKKALLPVIAAIGGSLVPPLIHFAFNHGLPTQPGAGIPMATDIAFAIGILSLVGRSIPFSLRVFLTALAIIDDLIAIITISLVYSDTLSFLYLGSALFLSLFLCILNRMGVNKIWPYILGGIVLWIFLHHSGIHATITGVLIAFALPFRDGSRASPSYKVQHALHYPVAFIIMPLFALANTGILFNMSMVSKIISFNGIGIILGLLLGKVIGIGGSIFVSHTLKLVIVPKEWKTTYIIGVGFLGGIGFTMSIFISLIAFKGSNNIIDASKIAVLIGSAFSGLCGYCILKLTSLRKKTIHS